MAITDMTVRTTEVEDLLVITSKVADDERGAIRELFRASTFGGGDLPGFGPPLQVNLTESRHGAIRGLHGEDMSKLVGVTAGEGFGAYVDLRPGGPSFGVIVTVALHPGRQVLVPRGVCNGFQSVSPGGCSYLYCFDGEWMAGMAGTAIHPLDPELAVPWPIEVDPGDRGLLSAKDAALPSFAELRRARGWADPKAGEREGPAGVMK